VKKSYYRWFVCDVSQAGTESGDTPAIVLAAWTLFSRSPGEARRYAAAANPRTPQWALRWLLRGHPKDHESPNSGYIIDSNSLYILLSMSANPALSHAMVEDLVVLVQSIPGNRDRMFRQVVKSLCRHPHLSATRRSLLVREGTAAAGLAIHPHEGTNTSPEMVEIFHATEEMILAASHLTLSQEEVEVLSTRWRQNHEAYGAAKRFLQSSGAFLQKGHTLRNQEEETERALGRCAVLLVTHPQIKRECQQQLIAELNSGEASLCIWEYALRSMTSVEEQVPRMDHVLFEARVEGLRGKPVSPIGEEFSPWSDVLRHIKYLPLDSSDHLVIQASLERSPETAAIVVLFPELRERISWTPEIVRRCLLSPVKEVRLFGLEGVAVIKSREVAAKGVPKEGSGGLSGFNPVEYKSGDFKRGSHLPAEGESPTTSSPLIQR